MSKKRCPDCDGPEITLFGDVGSRICSECHGTGKPDLFSDPLGVVLGTLGGGEKCSACGGSGECKTCGGTGVIENDNSEPEEPSFFGFPTEKRSAPGDRKSDAEDDNEAERTAGESGATDTSHSEYERVNNSERDSGDHETDLTTHGSGTGYSDVSYWEPRRKRYRSRDRSKRGGKRRSRSFSGGYSYGGGSTTPPEIPWPALLGFGLAGGIVIIGIVWVIYSLAHFSPGAYNSSSPPSITSGPNASAVQAYNDGVSLLNQGRYKESIAYFDEVVRLTPDYIFAYVQRGIAYANIRQFDRAILDYTEALRLNPNHPIARLDRASAYANSQQYKAAIADYTVLIGHEPSAEAYKGRASAFSGFGQHGRALEDLASVINLNPNDAEAFYMRGLNQNDMGLNAEALNSFTEAIRLRPIYAEAHYSLGYTHASLGQLERAIADYTEAIRLRPDSVNAYISRGFIYGSLAQYPKAIADYEEALRLAPENARAREQLDTFKALSTPAMVSEPVSTYELNGHIHEIPKPRQTGDGQIPLAPPGHGCASVRGVIQRLGIGDGQSREFELPLCGK